MNLTEKPHWDADSSVSSVLRQFAVFRISKPFLSKFITPSRDLGLRNPRGAAGMYSPLSYRPFSCIRRLVGTKTTRTVDDPSPPIS
jgi:hypothetical protein